MADVRVNDYKLMRARDGRMLAGVAAGLAQAAGLDVTLVRLCIGAMVLSGFGVAAYILMWIILPEESPRAGRVIEPAPEQTARIIRVAVVGLAVLSLFNKVGGFWGFANPHARGVGFDGGLGLILLGVGIAVLVTRHRPDRALWEATPRAPTTHDDDDTPRYAGPLGDVFETVHDALSDTFSEVRTTIAEARPRPAPRPDPAVADLDLDDDDYDAAAARPAASLPIVTVTGDTNRSGGGALIAARVVGWLVLIWWALASLAITGAWIAGAVTVRSPVLLGVASWLVFIGVLNTLLHAKFARAIVPALALLAIPVAIAATTVRITGDVGDFTHTPAALHTTKNYRQAVGRMTVDLTDTHLADVTTINDRMGVGQLIVIVPNDATVKVRGRTMIGSYELFGTTSPQGGINVRTTKTLKGCEGAKTVKLNVRMGVGDTQVRRANGRTHATCAG